MTALLLSGGLDSAAIAWWKKPKFSFFVNYGQTPFIGEQRAAHLIAKSIKSKFIEINIDCRSIGSGSLAASAPVNEAPSKEWWPFRNQLLLTLAAPVALRVGAKEILMGSVKTDSFHKDGTLEFFERMNELLRMQEGNISVLAPAIEMKCEEIIRLSGIPPELISGTHSCHVSDYACGLCEGCIKHFAVLRILGIEY
jgi:7-cyano-7-deazaguanine synthase